MSAGGRARAAWWAAFLAWAAAVWILSSRSDPRGDLGVTWDVPDWLAHGVTFLAGGFLARGAFLQLPGRPSPSAAAVVVCGVWGLLDEVHQGFVPGRATDPWDLVADVAGAALGAALHALGSTRAAVRAARRSL